MYYTRSLEDALKHSPPEFDARNILRVLNYFPFINRRHVPTMLEAMGDPKWVELFCDMSAATITQLHDRKMIDLETVWQTVSQFFHQAIQLRGFETVPDPVEAFAELPKGHGDAYILVAGTQSPAVFQSRVDRCIQLLRTIQPESACVTFSGANPYGSMQRLGISGGVVTLNEAADMEVYFRQKISEDPLPSKIKLMLRRESESDSTLSNIDHFFKTLPASTQGHIYIVSSLFHLPRFIDLTTARIVEKKLSIAQLTFASAEDPWKPHTAAVREVDYLKSCMYEFFLLLYRAHQAEKLFQPVTQNF